MEQEYDSKLAAMKEEYNFENRKKVIHLILIYSQQELNDELAKVKEELERIEEEFPKQISDLKKQISDAKAKTEDYEKKTQVLSDELKLLKAKKQQIEESKA